MPSKSKTKSETKPQTTTRPDRLATAAALRETGMLIDLSGGNPYKARAYIKGAAALERLEDDFAELVASNDLTSISGIGEALAASISEFVETGTTAVLDKLRAELPPGALALSQIPGLTLRRIRALYDDLHIKSIEDLEAACHAHKIAKVKGFGARAEELILAGLAAHKSDARRILLLEARALAEGLSDYLKRKGGADQVFIVGDVRRWLEVIGEIKIAAIAFDAQKLWKALAKFPTVAEVVEETADAHTLRLLDGVTVKVCLVTNAAAALIAETGTDTHFALLQERASGFDYKLDKAGVHKGRKLIKTEDEAAVYKVLNLAYIPPELRNGEDEVALAADDDFDDLVTQDDIRGMTHVHTTYSDGSYSVEEMALAAQKLGMEYLTITDHSPQASYANGLSVDQLKRLWAEMEEVQERVKIKLLKGTECDILADGKLDYPDHILSKFDLIIASVHQRFKLDRKAMTARVTRAMKDRHFKVWGHPLGRLLLRREPIDVDVEAILDVVAESHAAIEIDGDPHRLDFEPRWVKACRERGIKMIISTDAHSISDYDSLKYGVHMARRAGARRNDVLNTYSVAKFCAAVRPGK